MFILSYIYQKFIIYFFNVILRNNMIIKYGINFFLFLVETTNLYFFSKITKLFIFKANDYIIPLDEKNNGTDKAIFHVHGGGFVFRIPYEIIKYKYEHIKDADKFYVTYKVYQEENDIDKSINLLTNKFIKFIKTNHYKKYIFVSDSAGCSILYNLIINLIDLNLINPNDIKLIFISPFCIYPEIQFNNYINTNINKDYLTNNMLLKYTKDFKLMEFGNPKYEEKINLIKDYKLKIFVIYGEHELLKPSILHFIKLYNLQSLEAKEQIHAIYFYYNNFHFDDNNLHISYDNK